MKTKTLTFFKADSTILFQFKQADDGTLELLQCLEEMKPACERWVRDGISEWILDSTDNTRYPRHTKSSHPDFLIRLKDYIDGQFSFRSELLEEESPAKENKGS